MSFIFEMINKSLHSIVLSFKNIMNSLKDGGVFASELLQNTALYKVKLANCSQGLWACIEETTNIWKLTITNSLIQQVSQKATQGKQTLTIKDFTVNLVNALTHQSEVWSVGIMTPLELQLLRNGESSKQVDNNKIFLILTNKANKTHFPFTFLMNDIAEKQKLLEGIRSMKFKLEELKLEKAQKSQSSFSILTDNNQHLEQIKLQNQEIKKQIKIFEDSLTQKRGAVEIDLILKEKNNFEMQAETKKRTQNRQIVRMKAIYQLANREINEIKNEVDLINKQLIFLQDSVGNNAKLKSHALKVIKSYENELRTQKKVLTKQQKQIETFKRNLNNSKNNEKKVLLKIKQIQGEIEQAKKKTNIKEISNRLYSKGNPGSSVGSSSKAPSVTSSLDNKAKSLSSAKTQKSAGSNIVRVNLLNKNTLRASENRNNMLKTTPNINAKLESAPKPNKFISTREINSSHRVPPQVRSSSQDKHKIPFKQTEQKSIEQKIKEAKEKERQKVGIDRLSRSKEKLKSEERKVIVNEKKPTVKNNGADKKEILNKMKEIKNQYTNQLKNERKYEKITEEIAKLTKK